MDIIREESRGMSLTGKDGVPSPAAIRDVLNDYVIGQDHAKRILSVAVHNHYKRLEHSAHSQDVELSKSNILLLGPTGSGRPCWRRRLRASWTCPVPGRTRQP